MTRSFVVLTALLLLAGCGSADDENPGLGAPPTYPVPGCEDIDHRACDIRAGSCQERLMALAACLRGSEPMPVPPITNMSPAELAAYFNQSLYENPPPDPNHYEIALTLFDLVEPGALGQRALVEADVEFTAGFYRWDEKDVIIVDRGMPADDPGANSVLLHEFVHALQDADVDLARLYEEYSTSYDAYMALASVFEGEAWLYQWRFWSSLLGLDPAAVDWTAVWRERANVAEERALQAASPYSASYGLFPYDFGARFVHHAWLADGRAGVDALFASPPTRAVAVMASETELVRADWPEPEFPVLEPPAPFALSTETTLGAWGLFLVLSGVTQPSNARVLSHDLVGDRFAVYVASEAPLDTVAVWHLEFSNEASATSVAGWARQMQQSGLAQGNRAVLAVTNGTTPELDWALVP